MFASRTFDLENDRNLRELFDVSNSEQLSTTWRKLEVGPFSEQEILEVIGESYRHLSNRLKELLHTPSSLYVWSKLDRKRNMSNIATVFDLMTEWWKEIVNQCAVLRQDLSRVVFANRHILPEKIVALDYTELPALKLHPPYDIIGGRGRG